MVSYSFVLKEVVDAPHFLQSQHHFGYKLLLYASEGATPRCIAKLASAHFVSGRGWLTRINVSKLCYYAVRGATFSSKSHHGFPVLFLRLLLQLVERARSRFRPVSSKWGSGSQSGSSKFSSEFVTQFKKVKNLARWWPVLIFFLTALF